jgi:acetate kinase
MTILVLNCGSSSLKFQVLEVETRATERRLARGAIERIGEGATITLQVEGGEPERAAVAVADHEAAVRQVADWLTGRGLTVDAVGHRVVHGGQRFVRPAPIDETVTNAIEELEALAPLHNAPSLAGIRAARAVLGRRLPMVAVFDTAFHATLPDHAAEYALPRDLARRHQIRRYGFHGSSYRWVLARYCALTGTEPGAASLIALHLGNGSSAVAIENGRSVDTSMGFTPLEGLVMGTRAGDLDPAIVAYLVRVEHIPADEVAQALNERAGLLGVSGVSRDMRELLEREATTPRARLAVDLFCYRARKYVGAYLAALGGAARAVVFTGGIGEHAPEVRARICAGMAWSGLTLDPARNVAAVGVEARLSPDGAGLPAFVIPTDEERVIARDTVECLQGRR